MILYDDSKHRYYNDKDETYYSATQLVGLFCNDFDTFMISQRYARKNGQTAEHWQREWAEKSKAALVRGTGIHKDKEQVWMPRTHAMFEKHGFDYMSWPDGEYSELTWFNHELKIAGRSDKAIFHTTLGRKRLLCIEDYKTNREISTRGWFCEPLGTYRKMKYPVSHMEDCDLSHFELQLSAYMYCGEKRGFTPGSMTVIHIPWPDPETGIQPPEVRYPLQYRRNEVISMAKHAHVLKV